MSTISGDFGRGQSVEEELDKIFPDREPVSWI